MHPAELAVRDRSRSRGESPQTVETTETSIHRRLEGDLFVLGHEGGHLVYAPLRGAVFRASEYAAGIAQKVIDGQSLTDDESRSRTTQHLRQLARMACEVPRPRNNHRGGFRHVTLLLTQACNLRCVYCYAGSDKSASHLSRAAMLGAVEHVLQNAAAAEDRRARVTYLGGGEPTVRWKHLVESVEFARALAAKLDVGLSISLVTNGTLLDEERASWVASQTNRVSVSTEILPDVQDRQRRYAGGGSTAEAVTRSIRLLLDHGATVGIRSTITNLNVTRMAEAVEYAGSHLKGCRSIHLEPMADGSFVAAGDVRPPGGEAFAEGFMQARRVGKALGIDVACSVSKSMRKAQARFCTGEFCVTPDGEVTACHRVSGEDDAGYGEFVYGGVGDGRVVLDISKFDVLRGINAHALPECGECYARWTCAGDCLALRAAQWKTVGGAPVRCELVRELTKRLLVEKVLENEESGPMGG